MEKRVTIVGCGALGSHVAMLLRNEAELRLVDDDRVEQKNVMAQFHAKRSVGRNKAVALQQQLKALWGVNAAAHPVRFTERNAGVFVRDNDLVIDCVDNAESREVISGYCRGASVPLLHGALAPDGAFGRACWDEHFQADTEAPGAATCEAGEFLPFIAVVSSTVALCAQLFLREGKKVNFNHSLAGAQRF
jgi:molybdopterin/thiamine biosynthesis adenylyltransferase